ncbi:MAG TPA: glucose-1-phosphate adenylyltransferase [Terriglobales bacterium]|nr:glucose-1-phosphate adenylyltransferase [Terriglobales bacterium]
MPRSRPHRVLALVLAGGRGQRLQPLTRYRSKPSVPFGGRYRIVDFVLSNLVNSGINAIYILTQYKAQSLISHIQRAWWFVGGGLDSFATVVPAQMQLGDAWYRGTADAIYQNLNLVEEYGADAVAVFGADHIYKMNIGQMVDYHFEQGAEATVACMPLPVAEAGSVGVADCDANGRIRAFVEKPAPELAPRMAERPEQVWASMGNYIFDTRVLIEVLHNDARQPGEHDFGRSILPAMAAERKVMAYDFHSNRLPVYHGFGLERPYWRDVGTIAAYFEANMDLRSVTPELNLFNWSWPIMSVNFNQPPAKFVFDDESRRGMALQSLICGGCIVAGGFVKDSVLGHNVVVEERAAVTESVIMDNVVIGHGARLHRVIVDKNAHIAPDTSVGFDPEADRARGFHCDPAGITVVPKEPESPESRVRYR